MTARDRATKVCGAAMRARRGQIWSTDFVVSLLIFALASIIAFVLVNNALQHDEYFDVSDQAVDAANLLVGEGYPRHWMNTTVIRAGLQSDDHLSLRKAQELQTVPEGKLRPLLRATDDLYIYFTDAQNNTVPVFGVCGLGPLNVTNVSADRALPAASIAAGPRPVAAQVSINLTNLTPSEAYTQLLRYDVLLIEGSLEANTTNETVRLAVEKASRRGMTIIVVGDPGFAALGIKVNRSNATSITIQGASGAPMGLSSGEVINLSATPVEIPTIGVPAGSVTAFTPVGLTDEGMIAYATWLFEDSRVWYFATAVGDRTSGQNMTATIAEATPRFVRVPWPSCGPVPDPDAEQIAVHTRALPYHDDLLLLHVIAWRDR